MANRFGEPEDRLTPQEMAAAGGVASWRCPRCGTDWRGEENTGVAKVRHPVGEPVTTRTRFCRRCKNVVKTQEAVVPEGHRLLVVPVEDDLEARVA